MDTLLIKNYDNYLVIDLSKYPELKEKVQDYINNNTSTTPIIQLSKTLKFNILSLQITLDNLKTKLFEQTNKLNESSQNNEILRQSQLDLQNVISYLETEIAKLKQQK